MTNEEIGDLLEDIAAAYEVKGANRFRIMAYQNASEAFRHTSVDLKKLWQEGKLESIGGIGPSIASHLSEVFEKGESKHFQKIIKSLPEGMFELLKLPGIGPKTAYKLAKRFKLNNASTALLELGKIASQGEIRKLSGFGEKSEKKILEAIEDQKEKKGGKRMLLPVAEEVAQALVDYLKKEPACKKIEALGSLRRKAATIGDVDLAVSSNKPKKVIDKFTSYPEVKKIAVKGEGTARINLRNGRQIDLKVVELACFGSLLQHFTGSKAHNIALREYALKKGWSLSEYGIKKLKTQKSKLIKFSDEEKFYRFLGLDYILPELREGEDEIESAKNHKLPNLVKLSDIKGDLHIHSNIDIATSHDKGSASLEQIGRKAAELGYRYVAIADHNPATTTNSEKKIFNLLEMRKAKIDKYNNSSEKREKSVYIFCSLEVDIKPDGSLALPKMAFDLFDFLIAAVHTSFNMSKKKMTKRILSALKHPKVKILAHPTGRMLNRRSGYEADWDKIFEYCKKNKKFLEINAWPLRLDLPDLLARRARGKGVKFIVNTDSHELPHMDLMRYGVYVARRGWCEKSDIINTRNLKEISKYLISNT